MMPREERKALVEKIRYKHFKLSWEIDKNVPVEPCKPVASATIAYAPVGDDGDVFYAYTFCAPGDQFSRKEGRNQARRKLFKALVKGLGGHSGQLKKLPNKDGGLMLPALMFPPVLRRWLHNARDMGIATSRWYYELPGTEPATLKVEPLERKR